MKRSYGQGLAALVVCADAPRRRRLEQALAGAAFEVVSLPSLEAARERLGGGGFALVLAVRALPDGDALALGPGLGADHVLVVIDDDPSIAGALGALRAGAADYLTAGDVGDALHERVEPALRGLLHRREDRQRLAALERERERLYDLVVRDPLTSLFNQAHFQERLDKEIARSERSGHHLGLLFIDLDGFKSVNDRHGHATGDAVLRATAEILRGLAPSPSFRAREQDVAARYGGDEFVLLLPETTKGGAVTTAERLRLHTGAATLGGPELMVTASIGVASYPSDGYDRESLLRAADTALYAAKRLGKNRVVAYNEGLAGGHPSSPAPVTVSRERLLALDRSLAGRSFEFAYQPIVACDGFRLFGYEALCRPQDGRLGTILEAIATAERTGKMVELGRMLRELAVRPVRSLGGSEMLFVNLHPHELGDPTLTLLDSMLRPWAPRLALEISESVAVQDYAATRRIIRDLHDLGFKVALDDLGAGHAGLQALAQLEADFIKLDKALVHDLREGSRTSRLIEAIVAYAASEGIVVVAEGIETQHEWDAVRALGCPLVQGFFVGAPAPAFTPVTVPQALTQSGPVDDTAGWRLAGRGQPARGLGPPPRGGA
jgi:diguanylate cyclase (GGDEF)-like protein